MTMAWVDGHRWVGLDIGIKREGGEGRVETWEAVAWNEGGEVWMVMMNY